MTRTTIRNAVLASFAFVAVPTAAQPTDNGTTYEADQDDDGFDWGLLGLLGLAGLLGLKKKDNDVHVDARRNTPR
jgi:hypothetical protein